MELQYSLYALFAPLSAVLALGGLYYVRRCDRPTGRAVSALHWLIVCSVGWLALDALALLAKSPEQTLLWARLGYIFAACTPVAWLLFALHFAGRSHWMTTRLLIVLSVVPIVILAIMITDRWYGLVWHAYRIEAVGGFVSMHVIRYGPASWLLVAHGYILVLLGAVLIARPERPSFSLYRQQSRLMVVGALIPILVNAVHVSRVIPGLATDYTAIGFALACVVFAIGIARYRLFQVKPIARDVVVDVLDDPVMALDTGGHVVDLNAAAMALIAALPCAEARGRPVGRHVRQVFAGWPALAEVLPAAEEAHLSLILDTTDTRRYYQCHLVPLRDPRDRPAGQVIILHDVTAHKEAEAELRHSAQELERQNDALDAFARTVAHDLKNPLSVIAGYVELLNDDWEEMTAHDARTLLQAIADGGDWITHIVDELLLLAGVGQTKTVPIKRFDMGPIVEQAIQQLDRQINGTGAHITIGDGWPPVMGHAPWVTEVWINYVSNALKYGGRADLGLPPRIEIGYDGEPAAGHVRFWVRDEGPGITVKHQARLFIEFSRLHEQDIQGHGLGLSIVQRIIERLGGEVGVDSTPGEGSTFWFTLPRAGVTRPGPGLSETPPLPPETVGSTLRAARAHNPE